MKNLNSNFKDIKESSIVLVLSSATDYAAVNLALLKYLLAQKQSGVYVTINKPQSVLVKTFTENKIDASKIFFVDCVSALVKEDTSRRSENVVFVSPKNLTGISIAINELITAIPGKKFVFLDSLSTLLIYNSLGSMEKFSHFLANRFRLNGVTSVFLSLEGDLNPELLNTLSKFCDKVIKV